MVLALFAPLIYAKLRPPVFRCAPTFSTFRCELQLDETTIAKTRNPYPSLLSYARLSFSNHRRWTRDSTKSRLWCRNPTQLLNKSENQLDRFKAVASGPSFSRYFHLLQH